VSRLTTDSVVLVAALGAWTGANAQGSSLVGYVREDSTLRPLVNAQVTSLTAQRSARTNADGLFLLSGLAPGDHAIEIRFVGYEPQTALVRLAPDGSTERVFYLTRFVQQLDSVVVKGARPRGLGFEAFEERRQFGFGKFIDSKTLRANEQRRLSDILRGLGGVYLMTPPRCTRRAGFEPPYCDDNQRKRVAFSSSTSRGCPMRVLLDGAQVYRPSGPGHRIEWETTFDVDFNLIGELEAVEVYRRVAEMPLEFQGLNAQCGVLVLWSRRR
jgi:hypothetical protein